MTQKKPSIRQERAARLEAEAKRLRREEQSFWKEVSDRLPEICLTYHTEIIQILDQTTEEEPTDQESVYTDQYGGADAEDPYEILDLETDSRQESATLPRDIQEWS